MRKLKMDYQDPQTYSAVTCIDGLAVFSLSKFLFNNKHEPEEIKMQKT
jgi:hypothetical protein